MTTRSPMTLLEDAIVDLETSTSALDSVLCSDMDGDAREECIASMARLIAMDVVVLRASYKKLHDGKRSPTPPRGKPGLSVVVGE